MLCCLRRFKPGQLVHRNVNVNALITTLIPTTTRHNFIFNINVSKINGRFYSTRPRSKFRSFISSEEQGYNLGEDRPSPRRNEHHKMEQEPKIEQKPKEKTPRQALNSFIMKVHPDFFATHPSKQKINHESLQDLNSFLDTVKAYSEWQGPDTGFKLQVLPKQFKVTFYVRNRKVIQDTEKVDSEANYKLVSSEFAVPPVPQNPTMLMWKNYVQSLKTTSNDFLQSLFDQADEASGEPVMKKTKKKGKEEEEEEPEPIQTVGSSNGDIISEFRESVEGSSIGPKAESLLEEYFKKNWNLKALKYSHYSSSDVNAFEMLNHNLLFYAGLHEDEKKAALQNLKYHLVEIGFKSWKNVPIILTREELVEPVRVKAERSGFMVLSADFKPEYELPYITSVIEKLRAIRHIVTENARISVLDMKEQKEMLRVGMGFQAVEIEPPWKLELRVLQRTEMVRRDINKLEMEYYQIREEISGKKPNYRTPLTQLIDQQVEMMERDRVTDFIEQATKFKELIAAKKAERLAASKSQDGIFKLKQSASEFKPSNTNVKFNNNSRSINNTTFSPTKETKKLPPQVDTSVLFPEAEDNKYRIDTPHSGQYSPNNYISEEGLYIPPQKRTDSSIPARPTFETPQNSPPPDAAITTSLGKTYPNTNTNTNASLTYSSNHNASQQNQKSNEYINIPLNRSLIQSVANKIPPPKMNFVKSVNYCMQQLILEASEMFPPSEYKPTFFYGVTLVISNNYDFDPIKRRLYIPHDYNPEFLVEFIKMHKKKIEELAAVKEVERVLENLCNDIASKIGVDKLFIHHQLFESFAPQQDGMKEKALLLFKDLGVPEFLKVARSGKNFAGSTILLTDSYKVKVDEYNKKQYNIPFNFEPEELIEFLENEGLHVTQKSSKSNNNDRHFEDVPNEIKRRMRRVSQ